MASPALMKLSIANAPPQISEAGKQAALDIASARANKNAGGERVGGTYTAPNTTPVITPASLKTEATPVVSPPPTLTDSNKLQSDLVTQSEDAFNQKLASDKATAEATKTGSFKTYLDQLNASKGINTMANEAYSAPGGVDTITPELNDINDQIRREQRSLDLAKRNITEKGGGLASGALAEQQNLERVSLQKQADLSIIQMAVQGRYDSAKAIADRAVSAQFEEQQKKIDIAKFDYTENKDLFTKAEQREYDSLFQDRQNQIAEAKQNKQDMYELGVQASADGAPSSVVQNMFNAKTREEALAIGGSYIGALDRAAKQASINASNASAANSMRRQTEIVDVNGVKTLIDSQTGETISTISGDGSTSDAFANALASNDIENVSSILTNSAIGSAVGPSSLARTSPGIWGATKRFFSGALAGGATGGAVGSLFGGIGAIPGAIIGAIGTGVVNASRGSMDQLSGDRQNFVGTVENMRSELTKDKLAQAKGEGVTFGALSDGERSLIANAATKIGNWAITEDGTINSKVTGYDINETAFKREIDTINYFKKLDAVLQGTPPESIGVIVQPDGSMWVANSDGTLSELKRQ